MKGEVADQICLPLYIIGLLSSATPTYPVSSLSSLTAHSSGVSPSSIRPAGTSMTTMSTGGLYCFCSSSSGPEGLDSIVTMPTPSIGQFLGLV